MTIPAERLDQIAHRFAELEARMASGQLVGDAFVQASRDYAELEPVAKVAAEVRAAREEVAGLEEMLADPEMRGMAEEELEALNQRIPELEQQLAVAMLPRDSADAKPAMLEIRAGTGGSEAALFAGEDRVHGGLHIVVDAPRTGPAEESERPFMGVENHLLGLTRIAPNEHHTAVAKPDMGHLQGDRHAAKDHDLVRPVKLIGLARREAERDEGIAPARPPRRAPTPGITPHRIIAAAISRPAEILGNPQQRHPFTPAAFLVLRQKSFQFIKIRPQLRIRLIPAFVGKTGRSGTQNLAHRVPRQAAVPCNRLDRLPVNNMVPPNLRNRLHYQHPPDTPMLKNTSIRQKSRGSILDADNPR